MFGKEANVCNLICDEAALGLIYQIKNRKWYGEGEGEGDADGTGDTGGDAGGDAGGDVGGDTGGSTSNSTKPKMFTQEQVNNLMASNRRGLQLKVSELEGTISELKAGSLTAEESVKLNTRVKELSDQLLTKDELAKQEAERIKNESAKQITDLTNQFNALQERYTKETIGRAITDAAVINEAFSPPQIVALLSPTTSLTEELDKDGKATGNLIPRTKLSGLDGEGNPVILDLPVAEAVTKMKDLPQQYGNLFKANVTGGLGDSPGVLSPNSTSADIGNLSTEEYIKERRKAKKEGRNILDKV